MAFMSENRRAFYVVQFIELPFKGIDNYVCVPHTWLIVYFEKIRKADVAYPKDEDPLDTRERVKRNEEKQDHWRCYMAAVKYECDTFEEAAYWIIMNDDAPIQRVTNTQPASTLNNKLPPSSYQKQSLTPKPQLVVDNPREPLPSLSIKRPTLSDPKKQLDGKRLKVDGAAQSSSSYVNVTYEESENIFNNQAMEYAQRKKRANTSISDKITESRTLTQRTEQSKEALGSPIIDIDEFNEVIDVNAKATQGVKQSIECNRTRQIGVSNNMIYASMTKFKPTITQPNRHDNQKPILHSESSRSNYQPQIEYDRSIKNVTNEHESCVDGISNNELSTSHMALSLPSVISKLHTSRNSKSLTTQNQSQYELQVRLNGPQGLPTEEIALSHSGRNEYPPNNQNNLQQNLKRRPTEMTIPTVEQNTKISPNPLQKVGSLTSNLLRQMQSQLTQKATEMIKTPSPLYQAVTSISIADQKDHNVSASEITAEAKKILESYATLLTEMCSTWLDIYKECNKLMGLIEEVADTYIKLSRSVERLNYLTNPASGTTTRST